MSSFHYDGTSGGKLKTGARPGLVKAAQPPENQKAQPAIRTQGAAASKHDRLFHRGSLMFIEGEKGDEMFIIKSGKVKILKQEGVKTIELATLGPGSVLGEMSLLIDMPRSATAQVLEEVVALSINRTILEDTYNKIPPWLVSVIKGVVKRLADTMAKNSDNLVQDNIGGVVNLILLLVGDTAPDEQGRMLISLNMLKDEALYTIGISGGDTDKIITELILKELLVILKTPEGHEMIEIKRQDILNLYFEFLFAHFNNKILPGEHLSEAAAKLVSVMIASGTERGVKQKDGSVVIARTVLEISLEKAGMERFINQDAVDELKNLKIIETEEKGTDAENTLNKQQAFKFVIKKLEKLLLLYEWKATFANE